MKMGTVMGMNSAVWMWLGVVALFIIILIFWDDPWNK